MSETPQKQADQDAPATPGDAKGKELAPEEGEKKSTASKDKKKPQRSKQLAELGKNIVIDPQKPLSDRDVGPIKAYLAVDKSGQSGSFFALVCEPHLVPRLQVSNTYETLINPSLVKLIDYGVAYWPPARAERYMFVYQNDFGNRLLELSDKPAMGYSQEDIMDGVVKNLVDVLQDFRDKDFFHGNINPYNMFRAKGAQNKIEKIVLGDCLSLPPSYIQSVLYEPIERAMADPVARGKGTLTDDLYAMGVSLVVMLRASDPMEGLSDNDIIRQKIQIGSYGAITGKDRFKGSILELLRGLLLDDPTQRWTIDEVLAWLDGRRLSPKQATVAKKAPRPLNFMENKYFNLRILGMDMNVNASETVKIIENEELAQWLDRSLEDSETLTRVEDAVGQAREMGGGPDYQDRLASLMSAALDPMAPIRYKKLKLSGDGVGRALAQAMQTQQDTKPIADLFVQKIGMNWATVQQNPNVDIGGLLSRFDKCRNFLNHHKVGFGLERCLYTLCPEVQCLSPKLKNYYVTTPEYMVEAFEDMCEKGEDPAFFLDRHSIAFLSVKDSKCIDSHLYELDSPEEHKKILGNLKTLASIQKRSNMPPLPALASVFLGMTSIIYKRYHDQEIVEKIDKNIKKYGAAGDLVKMANLLDSPDLLNKDYQGFRGAMKEHDNLRRELEHLEARLENKNKFGKIAGSQFASIVASIISVILITFIAFVVMSGQTDF